MPRPSHSVIALLLFASTAATARGQIQAASPVPGAKSPPTLVTPTDDGRYFVLLRVLRTRVAPGDPFEVALHWAVKDADGRPAHLVSKFSPFQHGVDLKTSLETCTFTITAPDGTKHALQPQWPPTSASPQIAYVATAATQFYALNQEGLTLGDGTLLPWAKEANPL